MRHRCCALLIYFTTGLVGAQPSTAAAVDQAVMLETPTGVLHGSLLTPPSKTPIPVALLISGSGPTDRNGNSQGLPGANDSLKLLAQALASVGIASLRYDKRGIGESRAAGPKESDLRFETYVEDASAWVRKLKADVGFSTVTVIGHSEGSLIGMRAVEGSGADAFVSVAGIARRGSDVLRDQLRSKLSGDLAQQSESILASLEQAQLVDSVPQALMILYRPSVQPYLISWMRYTPTDVLKRLKVPVLIIQGTTDLQVSVAEAEALRKAKPEAEVSVIEGMNHVLKNVPANAMNPLAAYSDPTLPIVSELIDRLRAFALSVKPRDTSNSSFNTDTQRRAGHPL